MKKKKAKLLNKKCKANKRIKTTIFHWFSSFYKVQYFRYIFTISYSHAACLLSLFILSENRRSDLFVSPVKVWYSNKMQYSNKMLLIFCSLRFIFTYSARYFCCWIHTLKQQNCPPRDIRITFAITIKFIYRRKRWRCRHATEECSISWKVSEDITGRTWFISKLTNNKFDSSNGKITLASLVISLLRYFM